MRLLENLLEREMLVPVRWLRWVVEEDCRRDRHRLGCRYVRQYHARNRMTGKMPGKMSGVMGLGKKGVWMEETPAPVDGWFERSYGV